MNQNHWNKIARKLLMDEIEKRQITQDKLAEKLRMHGMDLTTKEIQQQLNQELLSAHFLLLSLFAIGVKNIDLTHLESCD